MVQRWYVVRTEPRGEYMAASELGRAGFEALLPCVNSPHPRAGHGDIPLFPGYLFLKCDLEEGAPQLSTVAPHVSGWVRFGDIVPPLPDEFVPSLTHHLATMSRDGGLWRRFRRGEIVQITAGSVQGLAEVVEEPRSPHDRVRVLLDFMGRLVKAQVPWQSLKPVEDEPNPNQRGPRRTRGHGRWIQGFGQRALGTS